jgi:hypothetical protein
MNTVPYSRNVSSLFREIELNDLANQPHRFQYPLSVMTEPKRHSRKHKLSGGSKYPGGHYRTQSTDYTYPIEGYMMSGGAIISEYPVEEPMMYRAQVMPKNFKATKKLKEHYMAMYPKLAEHVASGKRAPWKKIHEHHLSGGKSKASKSITKFFKDTGKAIKKGATAVYDTGKKAYEAVKPVAESAYHNVIVPVAEETYKIAKPVLKEGLELGGQALGTAAGEGAALFFEQPELAGVAGQLGGKAGKAGGKALGTAIFGSGLRKGRGRGRKHHTLAHKMLIEGGARSRLPMSGHKRESARGAIVAEVMKKQGLNLAHASRYVKEHGLY